MGTPEHQYDYRGFSLRLENEFSEEEARAIVDRALSTDRRRDIHIMRRPNEGARSYCGKPPRVIIKVERRDLGQPLTKRMRPARAIKEGRGYRFFAAAGLPVPHLLAFGEQSRLRPRCASLICTEKVIGRNAAKRTGAGPDLELWSQVTRTLARIHAAGFVHGDAVIRNFVPCEDTMYVIDLPRWGRAREHRVERDLAHCVGSTMKRNGSRATSDALLDAYLETDAAVERWLTNGWRERVHTEAEAYHAHVLAHDRRRAERSAEQGAG